MTEGQWTELADVLESIEDAPSVHALAKLHARAIEINAAIVAAESANLMFIGAGLALSACETCVREPSP
jgi:hypothetical protein